MIADGSKGVAFEANGADLTNIKLLEIKAGTGSGHATVSGMGQNIVIEELKISSEGTNTGIPTLDIGDNGMIVKNLTLKDDGSESSIPTLNAGFGTIVLTGNLAISGVSDSPTVSFSPAVDSDVSCEVILAGTCAKLFN